jgi:hypothetical protein
VKTIIVVALVAWLALSMKHWAPVLLGLFQ